MPEGPEPLQVDVWSDVVCPWCAVGRNRLRQAIAASGLEGRVQVIHRAFELEPGRRASEPSAHALAEKYQGSDVLAMMRHVRELAAADGLEIHPERAIVANTFDAHRLLAWARGQGRDGALMDRLVHAHFREAQDVADHRVLAAAAQACGLDIAEAREVLAGDRYTDEVRQDEHLAQRLGVRGVPFFVVGGRYAMTGAQPMEVMRQALDAAARADG